MDGELKEVIRDVDELKSRVCDLEFSGMNGDGERSYEPCIPTSGEERQVPVEHVALPTAFLPIWKSGEDGNSGKWTIYLPDGCVKVDNKDATFEDSGIASSRSGGYADLNPSAEIWCVVTEGSNNSYSYKLSREADDNSLFSFKICTFDDELNFPKDHVTVGMVAIGTVSIKDDHAPFQYSVTKSSSGGQETKIHKITNCKFYWDGELVELQDFDVTSIVSGGSAYLVGSQYAPSMSTPDPEWSWEISTDVGTAPSGGKVLNYKLYDFSGDVITIDYRTTFLSIEDTTQKAKFTVAKPSADTGSIVLDTTTVKPKIVVTDYNGHTISLDLADGCGYNYKIRPLKYYDSSGVQQLAHVLSCSDIDITASSTRTEVDINAGSGIKISSSTGTGTKSFTISNTGVLSVNGQSADSNEVNGTLTIIGVSGSGLKTKTVQQTPPTEEEPLSNGTICFDIEGRDTLPEECSKNFSARKFTYKDSDGDLNEYHFFGCSDIDISEIGTTELELGDDNVHLEMSGDASSGYTLSVPEIDIDLNAGDGIDISDDNTISNTGVIALTSGESSSQSLNGTVQVKGAADSGLVVSASQGQQPTEHQPLSNGSLTFDIEGRANLPETCNKHFAAREFKYKDENGNAQIYHFFGCASIDLSDIKAKQKQSDWDTTATTDDSFIKNKPDLNVDVVTGISMSVNTSGSTSKLVATITKRNLQSGNVTTTNQDVLALTNASVVASSSYTNDLKFVNTLVNLLVLGTATPSPSTVNVFETTPHSTEA